jgi:3-oxoacyl-[acyl-carrier protein] reductase
MELKYNNILYGKVAVLTGCLKGIGLATLDLFAQYGADIFACAEYKTVEFETHINELQTKYNVSIWPVYFDLSKYNEISDAARAIFLTKKPIDILVNIAGMTQDSLFSMTTMDQMKKIFEINFFSQIAFTQYIVKLMLKNKKGSIVNISSISGIDGNAGQLAYSATKAAVIAASKTLSLELSDKGIRVNVIAPGIVETDMTRDLSEDNINKFIAKSKLKRRSVPKEIASAILFLASDESSYITGQVLRVDGGIG